LKKHLIISFAVLILFSSLTSKIIYASDSVGVSPTFVIRSQLQRIADEVVQKANLDTASSIAVFVEGEGWRSLAENAFIESLQEKGYRTLLGMGNSSPGQSLQIYLLDTEIKLREIHPGLSERSVRTTLEARKLTGPDRNVDLIGTFYRQSLDTAMIFPALEFRAEQKDEKTGTLQKLLTPVIVISGAVLIIYLFFTVRS
jgi:hypothetical protein